MVRERINSLKVFFYSTTSDNEPVREWINSLSKENKKIIGADIMTVQFGYPIGMPLTRVLVGTDGLEEIRCKLTGSQIARIIFYVEDDVMILLHAFIKKTQKTPQKELDLAIKRYKELCK